MNQSQGDFNHWVSLINFFDKWLEDNVKPREELKLNFGSESATSSLDPLDVRTLCSILKVTNFVLENCSNKHLYNSYEVGCAGQFSPLFIDMEPPLTFVLCGGSTASHSSSGLK